MINRFVLKIIFLYFCSIFHFNCNKTISIEHQNDRKTSPNVVVLLADDQGWGDLGMNGNPLVNTPNLNKLAATGVSLDNFYVNSVCSPTRDKTFLIPENT